MKIKLMELLAGIETSGTSRLNACWIVAAFAENGYDPSAAWKWLLDNGMSSHVRHGFEQIMQLVLALPSGQRGYVEGWQDIAKWWAHINELEWIEGPDGVCVRPMLFNTYGARIVRVKPDPCEFLPLEKAVRKIRS